MNQTRITYIGQKIQGYPRLRPSFHGKGVFLPKTDFAVAFLNWLKMVRPNRAEWDALSITATYWFERPKSHFGTGKNANVLKERFRNVPMTGKPDIDNIDKAVLDCLVSAEVIQDDCRVCRMHSEKRYGNEHCVDLTIEPYSGGNHG